MSSWERFNRRSNTDGDHLAQHVPQTEMPTLAQLPDHVIRAAQVTVCERFADDEAAMRAVLSALGIEGAR